MKTKTSFYQQCKLERTIDGETSVMITWLPTTYAEVGRFLKLKKESTETWENGWVVVECYNGKKPRLDAVLASMDYRSWRDVTDM